MLAQSAPLLPLVAEQLRHGKPPDRLLQRLRARPDHAREGRRHFRSQGDLAVPLVAKSVQLPRDLIPALLGVQLQWLEWRTVVLLEAVSRGDAAPRGENVVAKGELVGVKISKAGKRFPLHRNNLADRRKPGQARHGIADGVKRSGDEDRVRAV